MKDIVKIMGNEVEINHSFLEFNEATLSDYLIKSGPKYSYYTQQLYEAQYQFRSLKSQYEAKFAEKFKQYKQGISDKTAEAYTKSDKEVVDAEKQVIAANRIVDKLKGYLRAWDMNNDNAVELARTLRKEMDKLGLEVKMDVDKQVQDVISE
jgi:hypothetical protein